MSKAIEVVPPGQAEVRADLAGLFRGAIRTVLEYLLNEEVSELIGAERYQRIASRRDYRNGSYLRRLATALGWIEVEVPRTRSGPVPQAVLERYQRREESVNALVREAYVSGCSTRDLEALTQTLLGEGLSRSTVSRVTEGLAEEVEAYFRRPLPKAYPYLFLDATFLDARWAGAVEDVSALVAYGVDEEGHRELLGLALGCEESEESWSELLEELTDRGLHGVRLVIRDQHAGLRRAVRRFLPRAEQQRCWIHFLRNILAKVPQRLGKQVVAELKRIWKADSEEEARRCAQAWLERWESELPEAAKILRSGLDASLTFYRYPKSHWRRIRSTNALERLHAEIKRRIDALGAFPDRKSALKLIGACALRVARKWGERRYLDMKITREPRNEEAKAA